MFRENEIVFSDRKYLYIMLPLVIVLIIDNSLVKIYDQVDKSLIPIEIRNLLYSLNTVMCLGVAFIVIYNLEKKFKRTVLNKRFNLDTLYRISMYSLFSLATLSALLIFQLLENKYYNVSISIFIISISYGVSASFLIRLFLLFLSWSKSRNNWTILLYGASMVCISLNLVMTMIAIDLRLVDRPDEIHQFIGGSMGITTGKYQFVNNIFAFSSVLSFVSIWITTALLMNFYREKLVGVFASYIILVIPILFFLVNHFYRTIFLDLFIVYLNIDLVTASISATIFSSLSKPIGGLIFAFLYWKISRRVSYEKNLRTCMIVSGWGILLIFAADQASSQTITPYPPFGLPTTTVMIFAAFLMLLGIYNSASLVSLNETLRKSIRNYASESKLLGIIGEAQMQKEMEKSALSVLRQTALERDSQLNLEFDVKELRKYVDFVRSQIRKSD